MSVEEAKALVVMPEAHHASLLAVKTGTDSVITLTPERHAIIEEYTLDPAIHKRLARGGPELKGLNVRRQDVSLVLDKRNNLLLPLVPIMDDETPRPLSYRMLPKAQTQHAYGGTPARYNTARECNNLTKTAEGKESFMFPSVLLLPPNTQIRKPRVANGAEKLKDAASDAAKAALSTSDLITSALKAEMARCDNVLDVITRFISDSHDQCEDNMPGALCGYIKTSNRRSVADKTWTSRRDASTSNTYSAVIDIINQIGAGANRILKTPNLELPSSSDSTPMSSTPKSSTAGSKKRPVASDSSIPASKHHASADDAKHKAMRAAVRDALPIFSAGAMSKDVSARMTTDEPRAPMFAVAGKLMAESLDDAESKARVHALLVDFEKRGFGILPDAVVNMLSKITFKDALFETYPQNKDDLGKDAPIVRTMAGLLGLQFFAAYHKHAIAPKIDDNIDSVVTRVVAPIAETSDNDAKKIAAMAAEIEELKKQLASLKTIEQAHLAAEAEKKKKEEEEAARAAEKKKKEEEEAAREAEKAALDAASLFPSW